MLPYLSLAIWVPIAAGLLVLAVHRDADAAAARWLALVGAVAGFAVTIPLYVHFRLGTAEMQFVEAVEWIPRFNVNYLLGIDGISLLFVLLNSFITVLVVWAGWIVIQTRVAQYMAAFLIMSGLINGVFASLDGVLFYVFFEAMLIPMYLIIGIWGGPNRVYAAIKFFLYTLLGSFLMLVAFIYLYSVSGGSFSILEWYQLPLSLKTQLLLFVAFFLSFAVKVPMWPVHTWLPDAHVEAPTGGSVVLGGADAQGRRVRLCPLCAADTAGRQPLPGQLRHHAVADRGDLHRLRRAGAGRHEKADRLFVDRAHGLCHAGILSVQRARRRGRPRSDALARLRLGGDVSLRGRAVRPHAQPADRRLRRRRQHDAAIRRARDAVRDGQRRSARHQRIRRRVHGDPRRGQGEFLGWIPRCGHADPRRRLHALDVQAGLVRRGR